MSIYHFSSSPPDPLSQPICGPQPQFFHHRNYMETPTKSSSASTSFWPNSGLHNHPLASASPTLSSFNFDLNNDDEEETVDQHREREIHHPDDHKEIPKEPLFEKPLTPSDVGKLNRLVIPKQHAEKYFPLNGNDSGEKGLLLGFEDELGKPWRFRYSYWNSSQSYVLTKGWSRFVKEKKLDAGDIVLFERHRLDGDRLFIGWRRRTAVPTAQDSGGAGIAQATVVGGGGWTRVYFSSGHNNPYPAGGGGGGAAAAAEQQAHHNHHRHGHGPGFPYQPDCLHAGGGGGGAAVQQQTTTGSSGSGNWKRLRLFGVNLECQQEAEEFDSDQAATPPEAEGSSGSVAAGQPQQQQQQAYYPFHQYYPTKVHHAYFNHHNQMNIDFSRDTNQTRYPHPHPHPHPQG